MVYFKRRFVKKAKTNKRKFYRRKAKGNVKQAIVRSLGHGLPKKCLQTLRYTESLVITSTTGIMQKQLYSCNSLYDPNVTGAGHQPLYFDQMTALYNHWTVVGSKITCRISPLSSTSPTVSVVMLINDDTTTVPASIEKVREHNQTSRIKVLTQGGSNSCNLFSKWSAKKTFGGSIVSNPNFYGTVSVGPSEQSYYTICVEGANSETSAVLVHTTIEYITVWTELKDISNS